MKGFANRLKDRRVVLIFSLAVVCVVLGVVLTRSDTPPAPVMVFHQPGEINIPKSSLFDRWIPRTRGWAWIWRLRETVLGRRRTVKLDAEIFGLADSSGATPSGLHLGKPNFSDTDGLQVWLLGQGELKTLREWFKQISGVEFLGRPRITTAEDIQSSIFQGETIVLNGRTNEVGLAATYFPRLRANGTDLFAILTLSESVTNQTSGGTGSTSAGVSIQTNLNVVARLQIPKGSGVFMLEQKSGEMRGRTVGVIMEPP